MRDGIAALSERWLAGLLGSLPFCIYLKSQTHILTPQEYVAATLGLLLAALVAWNRRHRNRVMPVGVAQCWPLLLVCAIVIPAPFSELPYQSLWLQPLAGAGVLVALSWSFALLDKSERSSLFDALCVGVVAGGAANLLMSLALLALNLIEGNDLHLSGLLAQRNLHALYLVLATVAIAHLRACEKFSRFWGWLLAVMFALMIALSASRAGLVLGGGVLLLAGARFIFGARNRLTSSFLIAGCLMVGAQPIAAPTLQLLGKKLESSSPLVTRAGAAGGLQRASKGLSDNSFQRRLLEVRKSWILIQERPILGYGWGGYTAQSVRLQGVAPFTSYPPVGNSVFTHSHNSPVQLLVNSGVVLGGLLLAALFWIALRALSLAMRHESLPAAGIMLLALGAHSVVEFPLWGFNFLLLFTMLIALALPGKWSCAWPQRLKIGFAVISAVGMVAAILLFWQSRQLFEHHKPAWAHGENREHVAFLRQYQQHLFFDYAAEAMLYAHHEPELMLNDIDQINERILAVYPFTQTLIRGALYSLKQGDNVRAIERVRLAFLAFPMQYNTIKKLIVHEKELDGSMLLNALDAANEELVAINKRN